MSSRSLSAPSHVVSAASLIDVTIAQRYRVAGTLGQGGMGSVVRVLDESTGKQLALKVATGSGIAPLAQEFRTLAHLRHPRVVEVYDYGAHGGSAYYTMELLAGDDLRGCAPLPWPRVCAILSDLVSALSALHVRRLVHRDVSPRNLRFAADGRVKLLDFGALSPFGPPANVIGTPSFIAPEALRGQPLDARSDLFAVGALAYYLLTGLNAYPASTLAEQQALLGRGYRSASARVRDLGRADLPELPAELDALVEALLREDPSARPRNAADVLDRLSVLAPDEVETERALATPAYVGRELNGESLKRRLERMLEGVGSSAILEGVSGVGRTRALSEFAIEARIAGALVLHVRAREHGGSLGVAEAIARKLLEALPVDARSAAGALAPTLAHLSPAVQEALHVAPSARAVMPQTPGEKRMRLQSALGHWFTQVARDRALLILVDDLQLCDEASVAWLATLAQRVHQAKLMLTCTMLSEDAREQAPGLDPLRAASARFRLTPLDAHGTRALVRSLFGDAPHLERLAELLHRHAAGLPAYCIELLEHLLRAGLVRYAEGSWVFSQNVALAQLPATRNELLLVSLRRLSPEARALGAVLGIPDAPIPRALCTVLGELATANVASALDDLSREGVLLGDEGGYRFASEVVRRTLAAELPSELARHVHRALGQFMLQRELGMDGRLQAGVHLLRGGDEQGRRVIGEAGLHFGLEGMVFVGAVSEQLQQAYRMLKDRAAPEAELVNVLAPLAVAGYYADRRLADRYAEETLALLLRLMGVDRAARLQRWLGRKLGLLVALGLSAWRLRRARKRHVAPSFREGMLLLFNVASCLTGVYTICIDPRSAVRVAQRLAPLTALGKDHVATLIQEFCLSLAGTVQDRIGSAYARWSGLIARLEARTPIEGLPEHVRTLYLAGALYARGVMEGWRDDGHALAIADKLDDLKLKLYEMSADQVRMMYYANQGRQELFERYRQRVEMHAIQRGTAWQVETWSAGALITPLIRTQDSLQLKHTAEQLRELAREVPSLSMYADRARGAYLLVRGRPSDALEHLERVLEETPLEVVGWARSNGVLARAYNALGAHARAREVCTHALALLSADDRQFTAMNLGLQIELALADAGLGALQAAADALDALIAHHGQHRGPLTMGTLHEARAEVARRAGDLEALRLHNSELERWYRETGSPSLIEHCQQLLRRPLREQLAGELGERDEEAERTLLHRLQHGGSGARFGLEAIAEFASLDSAYLVAANDNGQLLAERGHSAPEPLLRWVYDRLEAERSGDSVTEQISELSVGEDPNLLSLGEQHYRALPLFAVGQGAAPVGMLVVPAGRARLIPLHALDLLAARVVGSAAP